MDMEKASEVIDKFVGEHKIKVHKKGAIVFVGSGGGKSTFCRNQKPDENGKVDWIDEDLLYRLTNAHPCVPGSDPPKPEPWWTWGDEAIHKVELRCDEVNKALVDKGLWAFTTSFTPEAKCQPDAVVILPWEEQKKRITEKFNSPYYDGGAKPDEEGFRIASSHRDWTIRVAKENNLKVFDSIDGAVDYINSRE